MKIGVIGAGAVGLFFGSLLQRSGQDMHYLLRSDFDTINKNGLTVYSVNGDFHLDKLNVYRNAEDIGTVDLVLIALKTVSNKYMIDLVRPLVGPDTLIVTLQNGIGNEEILAEAFGSDNILGGVTYLGATRKEAGSVYHTNSGKIDLGNFTGSSSDRCHQLATMFSAAGIPCKVINDLIRKRWEKLCWNIPFNGLGALLNQDTAQLLTDNGIKDLIRTLIMEICAGANAQGFHTPLDGNAMAENLIGYTEKLTPYRPSMLVDRDAGRAMEIESILGVPVQQAQSKGVEMVHVAMLYKLLIANEKQLVSQS